MLSGVDNDYCSPGVLMRMVQGGSSEALDRITRCYGEQLLRAGGRYCRTRAEAEDAVQDAMVIAAERMGDFRGDGSLEGWLVRIVASACRRMSRGGKNDFGRHDAEAVLPSGAPSPHDLTCRGELGQVLQAALLELEPLDRMTLLLAEVEGWTAREIAAELGLTAGAVRTRLTRIRRRLRAALEPVLGEVDGDA